MNLFIRSISGRTLFATLSLLALAALPASFAFAADTGFFAPTSNTNSGWDNPQNGYTSNNIRSDADSDNDVVHYGGFSFPEIAGTITGIEVDVEGYTDAGSTFLQNGRQAQISLSVDGGATYTSGAGIKLTNMPAVYPARVFLTADAVRAFGGSTDKWGRAAWTREELANLRVKLDATGGTSGLKLHIDHVKVKVFYTAAPTTPPVPTNTTTTVTSHNPNPSNVGQAYTANVTVAPASDEVHNLEFTLPSGSVTVSDGTASCTDTTASVGSGGTVLFSCLLTSTTGGSKTLTATYTSSNGFGGSSGTATHTVNGTTPPIPTPGGSFEKGMVSLSFDDGLKGQTMGTNGAGKILLDSGFKGTFYIISEDMLGATLFSPLEYNSFMTKSEVLALAAAGNEVGVHTRTHNCYGTEPNCPGLSSTSADLLYEIDGSRYDLVSGINRLPTNTFAYPFGGYNDTVIAQLKKAGIIGARTVDFINALGQPTFNTPQTNPYKLAAVQLNNRTPITPTDAPLEFPAGTPRPEWGYVQKWIDDATATNTWLILIFHDIQTNCGSDSDCISPAKLAGITAYLHAKGSAVSVVPVKEGLAQMGYPATVIDTTAPTITLNGIVSGNEVAIETTSLSGAPVTFTTNVTDNVDAGLGAFCVNPAVLIESEPGSGVTFPKIVRSGDFFPLGMTRVNCSAVDQHGNLRMATFNFFLFNPISSIWDGA